jgi:hypothetical protein
MTPPRTPGTPATPGDRLPAGPFARERIKRGTRTIELLLPRTDQPSTAQDTTDPVSAPDPRTLELAVGPLVDAPRPFRRVVVRGTHVGKAYSLADVRTLWSRYGPPDADAPTPQHTHWEGGGPHAWHT